jgi:hypothetical protein
MYDKSSLIPSGCRTGDIHTSRRGEQSFHSTRAENYKCGEIVLLFGLFGAILRCSRQRALALVSKSSFFPKNTTDLGKGRLLQEQSMSRLQGYNPNSGDDDHMGCLKSLTVHNAKRVKNARKRNSRNNFRRNRPTTA